MAHSKTTHPRDATGKTKAPPATLRSNCTNILIQNSDISNFTLIHKNY